MKTHAWIPVLVMTLAAGVHLFAQDRPHLLRGATLYPIEGAPIQGGMILFQHGKILNLGADGSFAVPVDAVIVDVPGKVILPGLVDTHSHVGGGSGGDHSSALHPDVRILDAINVRSDTFKKVVAGGITTVNVMPGSGHLMSGQTAYLKMRPARVIEDMLFCSNATDGICGGMKMANGTNSIGERPFPGTRAKSAALVRQLFLRAQDYKSKVEAANGDSSKLPKRDLEMESLVQVLEGKRIVQFHTHRADDIMTAIRLSQEFGFRLVLHHVTEAWRVAREIAEANVPCSIIVVDSPGGKLEAVELRFDNGIQLEKAGVVVAFHSDDSITDSRLFLRCAALGVRAGMSREKALEGLTLAGAKMLDLDGRVGSLKPGKDADFAILSGDPFSVYTHVEETWVEGAKVFDRSIPEDRKYAVGGYGVFREAMTGDECEGSGQ
jgi:imidazolonepropionase-like amidohydrolase